MKVPAKLVTALLLLLLTPWTAASQDDANNYAYQMALSTDTDSALYQLSLPRAVYARLAHTDLRDVRVVNAEGEFLPSMIESTDGIGARQLSEHDIPFFDIRQALDNTHKRDIHVTTGKNGAIVNIVENDQSKTASTERSYILDLSAYVGKVQSLQLIWDSTPSERILAFSLTGSDDLNHWTALADASISYLEHQGRSLKRDVIELPPTSLRYLQLRSLDALGDHRLVTVRAKTVSEASQLSPLQRLSLSAQTTEDEDGPIYDAGARLPVSRINLDFGAENGIATAQVYGRADADAPWARLGGSTFYTYHQGGQQTQSEALKLSASMMRYFKLVSTEASLGGEPSPRLTVAWHPHRLIFLSQGRGPYRLVYGRADSEPRSSSLNKLVSQMEQGASTASIAVATPLEEKTLCGRPCLLQKADETDYTRYVLWLVIVAGVVLVVWIVTRLYRELNHESKDTV